MTKFKIPTGYQQAINKTIRFALENLKDNEEIVWD